MLSFKKVAPYAGAWIEIRLAACACALSTVAPYAGAWIEIIKKINERIRQVCRPLRGGVD